MASDPHILREVADIPAALDRAAALQAAACQAIAATLKGPGAEASRHRRARQLGPRGHGPALRLRGRAGVPAASLSPSLASVYGARPDLQGALCLVISQSGRSPDIRHAAAMVRAGGALTVAVVNDGASPLAREADVVLPIGVGPERSVAATKSFVGAVAAGLRLLATLSGDERLEADLAGLPDLLAEALEGADSDLEPVLAARLGLVLGRGASGRISGDIGKAEAARRRMAARAQQILT